MQSFLDVIFEVMTFIYIPLYLIFYIPKRIFFTILYPISYIFRKQINKKVRSKYDYLLWDKKHKLQLKIKPNLFYFLWFALDDAPYFLNDKKEYFDEYIPKFYKTEFLKSFYWSVLRNNAVNLSRVMAIKGFVSRSRIIGNDRNFAEVKHFEGFPYYVPYVEYHFGCIRFQAGWLTNGKFQIEFRKG